MIRHVTDVGDEFFVDDMIAEFIEFNTRDEILTAFLQDDDSDIDDDTTNNNTKDVNNEIVEQDERSCNDGSLNLEQQLTGSNKLMSNFMHGQVINDEYLQLSTDNVTTMLERHAKWKKDRKRGERSNFNAVKFWKSPRKDSTDIYRRYMTSKQINHIDLSKVGLHMQSPVITGNSGR